MIKAIFTEKGLSEAKKGKYSFYVDRDLNKFQIKKLIGDLFKVHVKEVRTINFRSKVKRDYQGRYKKQAAKKKALVTLKDKETIDIFEIKK